MCYNDFCLERGQHEKLLKNLNENLKKYNRFYKFNKIQTEQDTIVYDGKNPIYMYGIGFGVFMDESPVQKLMEDIAYKENGKYYQILTNKEVKIIKRGVNHIDSSMILAA